MTDKDVVERKLARQLMKIVGTIDELKKVEVVNGDRRRIKFGNSTVLVSSLSDNHCHIEMTFN